MLDLFCVNAFLVKRSYQPLCSFPLISFALSTLEPCAEQKILLTFIFPMIEIIFQAFKKMSPGLLHPSHQGKKRDLKGENRFRTNISGKCIFGNGFRENLNKKEMEGFDDRLVKELFYLLGQFYHGKRFLDESTAALLQDFGRIISLTISAGDKNLYLGIDFTDPLKSLFSSHLRHDHV